MSQSQLDSELQPVYHPGSEVDGQRSYPVFVGVPVRTGEDESRDRDELLSFSQSKKCSIFD